MGKKDLSVYAAAAVAWTVYLVLTLSAPFSDATAAQFGITRFDVILIDLTIAAPYLIAWLAGCYAGLTLFASSRTLSDKDDKAAYACLGTGVFILILSLAASSIIGAVRSLYPNDASLYENLTILVNYVYVYGPLVGFVYFLNGSLRLKRGTASGRISLGVTLAGIALLALFGVGYTWLVFSNPTRQTGLSATVPATYYLPDAAIVTTIVFPFLAACAIGCLALYVLLRFYRGVTGFVYKEAARNLIVGLTLVIFAGIFLQALLSLGTSRLLGLGLGPLLFVIYVLIAAQTFGKLFIAFGARKLAAIERIIGKYESSGGGKSPAA